MSGSIDYSQLFTTTGNSIAGNLLTTLYGGGGAASANSPADALSALDNAEQTQTQDIAATAAQPSIARDVATFTAAVKSATSVNQLLSNPTVLKVLLTANGLGDQTAYPALAIKALTSNLSNPKSLANTLSNTAWQSTAATYQFATAGLSIIQQPSVIQTITSAYAEVQWRQSLDAAHPGLSNALTFRAEAQSITSVDQILGDPILRDVVTTALGIPLQIAIQPLEAQQKAISSQLDISKFQSPSFTEQFVQRYLVAKAEAAQSSGGQSLDALAAAAAGLVA